MSGLPRTDPASARLTVCSGPSPIWRARPSIMYRNSQALVPLVERLAATGHDHHYSAPGFFLFATSKLLACCLPASPYSLRPCLQIQSEIVREGYGRRKTNSRPVTKKNYGSSHGQLWKVSEVKNEDNSSPRPSPPAYLNPARNRARRRLCLAACRKLAGSDARSWCACSGYPRSTGSRECLHVRHHGRHRRAATTALRRDEGTHQGRRFVCAGA